MSAIESTRNPRVKAAAALRNRRERDATGLTIVDGVREVERALGAGAEVVEAFVDRERLASMAPFLSSSIDQLSRSVHDVPPSVLQRIAYGERAEGIVAVVRVPDTQLARLRLPEKPLIVVVEAVEKAGNLGAIVRSADGAGADAVIAADPRTDLFNPNAIRASLGTMFSVSLASAPGDEVAAWLTEHGIRTVAAVVDAVQLHSEADLTGAVAIVLGTEASGLSGAWRTGDTVRLPMLGIADSLNVSVAAAVLLYEARRQRDLPAVARS